MELAELFAIIASGFFIAGLLCALMAIWETRTTQGAVAWAISLVTFPYLAVPLYLVFGRRKFQGYLAKRRSTDLAAHRSTLLEGVGNDGDSLLPRGALGSLRVVEKLADMPFTRGNDTRLLIDGTAIFDAIFAAIEGASDYVLVQFYIVRDDGLGNRLAACLREAAQRGVRVYLLYDEIGSNATGSAYFETLRQAGVEVSAFGSTLGRGNRFQLNFRNHRKVVVVDGRIGFTGGSNVGDEYLGLSKRFGPWRDTHLQIEGPIVQAVQSSFEKDWYWAQGRHLDLNWNIRAAAERDQTALILPTGPADPTESCSLFFVQAINAAVERIWIVSPYFVPDLDVMAALHLATLRGVDVRIMVPEKADNRVVWLAAFAFFEDAASQGVRFFRYQEGFLHQKVILVDAEAAAVGTANLDNRSFRLNFEITAVVIDRTFAKEVEAMLLDDFERCREYHNSEYEASPVWFKLAVRLARLASPIL